MFTKLGTINCGTHRSYMVSFFMLLRYTLDPTCRESRNINSNSILITVDDIYNYTVNIISCMREIDSYVLKHFGYCGSTR